MFAPFAWLCAGRPHRRLPRDRKPSDGPTTHPPCSRSFTGGRPSTHGRFATSCLAEDKLDRQPFTPGRAFRDPGIIRADFFQEEGCLLTTYNSDFILSRQRPRVPRGFIRIDPRCLGNHPVGIPTPPPARRRFGRRRLRDWLFLLQQGQREPMQRKPRVRSLPSVQLSFSYSPPFVAPRSCRAVPRGESEHCRLLFLNSSQRCCPPSFLLIHATRPAAPLRHGPASRDPQQ